MINNVLFVVVCKKERKLIRRKDLSAKIFFNGIFYLINYFQENLLKKVLKMLTNKVAESNEFM